MPDSPDRAALLLSRPICRVSTRWDLVELGAEAREGGASITNGYMPLGTLEDGDNKVTVFERDGEAIVKRVFPDGHTEFSFHHD